MEFPFASYKTHFENFGSEFYVLEHKLPDALSKKEKALLLKGGLPDEGLPFFFFNLQLTFMREIYIEDCLLPLGTCFSPESHFYIYLAKDHKIYTQDEEGNRQFVNSSLENLMNSIFCYSIWLGEIERIVEKVGPYEVKNEDVFELYYRLRSIDPKAIKKQNLWFFLLQTDLLLEIPNDEDIEYGEW